MVNYKGSLVILGGQNKANETVTSAEEFIQGIRDPRTVKSAMIFPCLSLVRRPKLDIFHI